jgi:formylglycine-generating enzyme required for sulfatase activity
MEDFAEPAQDPPLVSSAVGALASVQRRLDHARQLEKTQEQDAATWERCLRSIANEEECPLYRGLEMKPRQDLFPLGRDRETGLWEFVHRETGAPPPRDDTGRLIPTEESGLVFVLIPGGAFVMGGQSRDPAGAGYAPGVGDDAGPVKEVVLAPFFLSRYEMTQAQWQRITGVNPSRYAPGHRWEYRAGPDPGLPPAVVVTARHPVESITWETAAETVRRLGLELPTEAQWEYACRAGTTSVYPTGDDRPSLNGYGNLADEGSRRARVPGAIYEPGFADGFPGHAPVGSYRPNGFGLYDMIGNVWEWCRDVYAPYGLYPRREGDGLLLAPESSGEHRSCRGGSCFVGASAALSAGRNSDGKNSLNDDLGLRPAARVVTPDDEELSREVR